MAMWLVPTSAVESCPALPCNLEDYYFHVSFFFWGGGGQLASIPLPFSLRRGNLVANLFDLAVEFLIFLTPPLFLRLQGGRKFRNEYVVFDHPPPLSFVTRKRGLFCMMTSRHHVMAMRDDLRLLTHSQNVMPCSIHLWIESFPLLPPPFSSMLLSIYNWIKRQVGPPSAPSSIARIIVPADRQTDDDFLLSSHLPIFKVGLWGRVSCCRSLSVGWHKSSEHDGEKDFF